MDTVEHLFARFARHGDVDALAEVFDRSAPSLLRLAVQICGREAEAEDLLQATFLIAIEKARAFDPTRSLTAWLVGILQKQQKSLRRRLRRALPAGNSQPALDPGEHVAAGEVREAVRAALLRLEEPYRQALHLRLVDGLSTVEIAQRLGRTPGAVRVQLHRGLERMRQMLPIGLALGITTGSRGLAAVRANVVAAASGATTVGTGITFGGLLVKKLIATIAGAALAVAAWCWWPASTPLAPVPRAENLSALASASSPTAPSAAERREASDAAAGPTQAADDAAPGTLVVRLAYETGEPAGDVPIAVDEQRGNLMPCRKARTSAAGIASFYDVPPGPVHVTAAVGMQTDARVQPGTETVVAMTVPRGFRVLGRVVDDRGAPVPGAHVYERPTGEREHTRTTQADAEGRFELFPVGESTTVGARAPGGRRSPFVGGMPDAQHTIRLDLVVAATGADLAGCVVDAHGTPIEGARVLVKASDKGFELDERGAFLQADNDVAVTTGADGRFELPGLRAGTVHVEVASATHVDSERDVDLTAGQWHEVTLVLARGGSLAGRITDAQGHPIEGAYAFPSKGVARAFAGRDGTYRVPQLGAGTRSIVFAAPEHRWETRPIACEDGAETHCDVVLTRLPTVAGTVRYADDKPVRCSIDLMPADASAQGQYTGSTDADGRFAIGCPPDGRWKLRIREAGAMGLVWGLGGAAVASGSQDVAITLGEAERASCWITGRLVDPHDAPVRHATLGAICGPWRPRGGTSDLRDGSFRIGPLPPAEYRVAVTPRQSGLAAATLGPFTLAAHETRALGEVRLSGAGRFVLRAARADAVAAASLTAQLTEVASSVETFLRLEAMHEPGQSITPGRYRIHVHGDNFMDGESEVAIRSGETTRLDLPLEPAERRRVRYPVPAPTGWSGVALATIEIWRDGRLVYDDQIAPATEPQQTRYLSLGIGTYTLRIAGDGDKRFEGTFAVQNVVHDGPTIDVAVKALR